MNHQDFLVNLEESGFDRQGTSSCAFKVTEGWVVCIIGLSGRYQQSGTKAFVICARPSSFEYMDKPKKKYSTEPHEYPFKLNMDSQIKTLSYESTLLNYDYSRIETDSDWSKVYELLTVTLPDQLNRLGCSGLVKQIRKIRNRGFIEKIWLSEINA